MKSPVVDPPIAVTAKSIHDRPFTPNFRPQSSGPPFPVVLNEVKNLSSAAHLSIKAPTGRTTRSCESSNTKTKARRFRDGPACPESEEGPVLSLSVCAQLDSFWLSTQTRTVLSFSRTVTMSPSP